MSKYRAIAVSPGIYEGHPLYDVERKRWIFWKYIGHVHASSPQRAIDQFKALGEAWYYDR